ncbi:MAG: Crp/Fnr family transcriptional regulator [Chloroflexota bacterium]
MVSKELLRRFPFFGFLTPAQIREVALISDEISLEAGEVLFSIGDKADALYVLLSGSIDLHYIVIDEHLPQLKKDFLVGTINPGEPLAISAVIPPYELTATAVATESCTLLKIDGVELLALCEADPALAYGLQAQIARATMERLHMTRVLLAAATTPV